MVPKYYALKQEIIKLIDEEKMILEDPIPSERELCDLYEVSRITVRKAIDELVKEGYLYKIQGKGTYVKGDNVSQNLFSIVSCTDDILKAGMVPSRKLIKWEVIEASYKRAKELEIAVGDKVFKLDRVYYADNIPVNRTTTYLPCKLFPGIEKYDFSNKSLYKVLTEEYGVILTKAQRMIEAISALGETAKHLEIPKNHPIILFRAITYGKINQREIPLETFKSYYRTDKLKFYINQINL